MFCRRAFIIGLFDNFQIGRITTVGTDSVRITGALAQIFDGTVILTGAFVRNNANAIIQFLPVARIPLAQITFVA